MKTKFIFLFTLLSVSSVQAQTDIQDRLVERFVRYAAINTQSEEDTDRTPSTLNQELFASLLVEEMKSMGIENVYADTVFNIRGEIPANTTGCPTILLSAHMDTSPEVDLAGRNPNPIVHQYDGGELIISDKLVLTPDKEPLLSEARNGRIITSDGTTLLGGDDKAGISIALTIAETLLANKNMKHGKVKLLFTCDEEIGKGTNYLTKANIDADYGLVIDSRGNNRVVVENFIASKFVITISAPPAGHPGVALSPTINEVMSDILRLFPSDLRPANTPQTAGYCSYYRLDPEPGEIRINGRIREFDPSAFGQFESLVETIVKYEQYYLNGKYKHGHGIDIRLEITGEYNNSKAILEKYPRNYQILSEAFKRAQVTISPEASRGGSDANEITFMGIPTYNIFAGYVNEHSHKEWVSAIFMENSYKVILSYITLYGEHDY